ncbi:unnamed protein product [Toxocara canis]|uniref:SHR-BD domain-containing protein n=1 Tax=Toxocara canis TaxID=6265 RepID=A0A183V8T1_TOXCA|nr:unnamed protein product [Toxocara canis]
MRTQRNCLLQKDGKQYVDVVIKDLQLLSTYLASSKRKEWKYEVLKKVAINFNGAINNADKSNSFKLVIDTVLLKFSPVVVGLACAMSAHFASLKGREDAKAQERPQLLKSSSHYWMKEKVDRDKHWWFNVSNVPQEEFEAVSARTALPDRREEVTINVKSFSLVLETGQKFFTAPVFLVESSFSGVASNWSSLLSADAVLTLQASYFNEMLSAWEPLVEPVEIAEGHWKSWTMGLMVRSHSDEELVASRGARPQGKHSLTIQADCPLEITLTKSLLRLLVDLSLDKAMNGIAPPAESALICSAQYVVRNESGMPLQIVNSSTLELESKQTLAVVNDACYIGLYVPSAAQKPIGINTSCNGEAVRLRLNLKHNSTEKEVNVARAEIQTICLQHPTETDHEWKMVVETKVEDTRHIIILRSILQFENHMSIPIEVYSASDGNFKLCSTIMPSERPVSIPLMSLCDSDCKLKLKPAKAGYDLSKESVCWLKFVDKERYVLRCKSTSEATEMLYVVLVVEETAAKPYNVTEFNDKVEHDLASSEQINLNTASGTRIKFEICYRGDIYSSSNIRFSSKPQNFEVVKFCSKKKKLNLGMRWITEREQMKAQIFASYWFVNNTGKTLKYMAAAITQKPFTEPVLLPLSSRGFFNKKKAKVKIEESQWSNEFTLAAVGTTMRIKCKAADRDYEMSLDVYLSQSGLTKVVCFSPFFLIHNLSPLGVEIGQSGYDEWVKVEPQSVS